MSKWHGARLSARDKEKERYYERKQKGLCTRCGAREKSKKYLLCEKCLKWKHNYIKKRTGYYNE